MPRPHCWSRRSLPFRCCRPGPSLYPSFSFRSSGNSPTLGAFDGGRGAHLTLSPISTGQVVSVTIPIWVSRLAGTSTSVAPSAAPQAIVNQIIFAAKMVNHLSTGISSHFGAEKEVLPVRAAHGEGDHA